MKLFSLILLIGNCCFYWTEAVPLTHDNYHVSIDNGTLKNVSALTDSSIVDLSGLGIKYISENSLGGLTNVKILNLSNNKLNNLPPLIFSKLNNLEELSLANNRISSFNKTFVGLNRLRSLNISNNSIKFLREGVLFGLTKSTNIFVERNPIRELSTRAFKEPPVPVIPEKRKWKSWISDHERFAFDFKLCMTDNIVESIEEIVDSREAGNCIYISYYDLAIERDPPVKLSNYNIKGFKHGWYKITSDRYTAIDLSNNHITDITPELIDGLPPTITYINLQSNLIGTIENNGIEHKNLTYINLENNRTSTIGDGASEKSNVTVLDVTYNHLKSTAFVESLPPSIEKLYLDYNSILEIPVNSFRGLKKLKSLSLSQNHVKNIEPETFKNQENLLSINMPFNEIRELRPKVFQGLTSLHSLYLHVNKIEKVSRDAFKELRVCKELVIRLGANKISTIEEGTFSHMDLKTLEFTSNKLGDDSIAEGAFNGSRIQNLDFSSNSITKINGELFSSIVGLRKLQFFNNPIKNIKKGAAKYMGNVCALGLPRTQIEVLENGALFGLSTERNVVVDLSWTPIKTIQGGVFDDV